MVALDVELQGLRACTLRNDAVACWAIDRPSALTIMDVKPGAATAMDLPAGGAEVYVRTTTGELRCHGGKTGQCPGTGGHTNVRTFAVGHAHLCALSESGEVHCSGDDGEGRLGVPEGVAGVPQHAQVPGRFTAVDTAGSRTCAITRPERAVVCWGPAYRHEEVQDTEPHAVPGLERPAVAIAVGTKHACALLDGDILRCWGGRNTSGELGNGRAGHVPRPRPLSQLTAPRPLPPI